MKFKITSLLLCVSLIFSVSIIFINSFNLPEVSGTVTGTVQGGTLQWREHDYGGIWETVVCMTQENITGSLDLSSGCGVDIAPTADFFLMLTFERNALFGMTWSAYPEIYFRYIENGGGGTNFTIMVLDGAYLRSDQATIPSGSPTTWENITNLKVLQYGINYSTSTGAGGTYVNETFTFSWNQSPVNPYITILVRAWDTSMGSRNRFEVGNFALKNSSDDSILYNNDFECGLVYEVTGGENDYGYCGEDVGDPPLIYNCECVVDKISALNFEGDTISYSGTENMGWVFSQEKYYFFQVDYSSVNNVSEGTYMLQLNDTINNMTIQYHIDTRLYEILIGDTIIIVPTNNGSGWITFDDTLNTLNITFPVWFTEKTIDTLFATSSAIDGSNIWVDGPEFKIYNQGGLLTYQSSSGFGGSASFTYGGDWMEGCSEYYGFIQANQTWRKLQSMHLQYSYRFYENVSGVWIPEDQFMQSGQNSAGGTEKYGGMADWHQRWKIWVWDNVTSTYWLLGYIDNYIIDGDEGASDEWTAIKNIVYEHTTEKMNATWNSFIEEEPASRTRLWLDIWVNKINGSSVMGFRSGPYYYGMDNSGYLLWSSWSPQIDNSTEAMGFIHLTDGNGDDTYSSQFDLMKIEFELEMTGNGGSGEPYRVCVEDVNVAEINLADRGATLFGTDTPSPNKPIVIDMAQGGLLAPLYNLLKGIGDQIWKALSSVGLLVWNSIGGAFPWFTGAIEDIYDLMNSLFIFFPTLIGYLSSFLTYLSSQFWLIGYIVQAITDTWANITAFLTFIPVTSYPAIILLVVIIFVFIPFQEKVMKGDTGGVKSDLQDLWGIIHTVMDWSFRLLEAVISWITGLIR